MRIITQCLAFILFSAAPLLAAPLGVGDEIPSNFKAKDSLQREQTFKSLTGKNGLVVIFTRSADWCQYCKVQLRDWNAQVDALKEAGYALTAISYDAPTILADFEKQNELQYPLLSDSQSAMIKAFGIRNEKFDEGSRFYGIPNPAIYLFDDKGTIKHVFREADYQDRPEIAEVMKAITEEQ